MSNVSIPATNLLTLKGQNIPDNIVGDFSCVNNDLTSLEFGPQEVSGDYFCRYNNLMSLEFCASKIGEDLYADHNLISNLKGIHKHFKNGYIGNRLTIYKNPLKSHVLGVILIPKLQIITVDNIIVQDILKKHLSRRDVLECQEQLIQNGFKEFAKL